MTEDEIIAALDAVQITGGRQAHEAHTVNTLLARIRTWLETSHQRRTRTYNATHGAVTTRPYREQDIDE